MAQIRLCSIADCGKAVAKREWCNGHYIRWRRHGSPTGGRPSDTHHVGRPCLVVGCKGLSKARGYCNAHHLKLSRHGSALIGKTIPAEVRGRQAWLDKNAVSYLDRVPCLIVPTAEPTDDYTLVVLKDGTQTGSHRYVCEAAHGPPPSPEHEAAHSCGIRPCVNRWHLRWATVEENAADKLLHGTDSRGEKNGNAKLTRLQVDEIIRLRGIETGRSLASRFDVTPAQISHIQRGDQWAYEI